MEGVPGGCFLGAPSTVTAWKNRFSRSRVCVFLLCWSYVDYQSFLRIINFYFEIVVHD